MDVANIIIDYVENKMSTVEIAEKYNTYPKKISRILIKNNIQIRDRSDRQKLAIEKYGPLAEGKRGEEFQDRMAEIARQGWANRSEEEVEEFKEKARERWKNKTPEEKEYIKQKGHANARKVVNTGSRIERYIYQYLLDSGFEVLFHKNMLTNGKLQVDMYIPSYKTIIEVNGPSHFIPIWGEEKLIQQQKSDNEKMGLILQAGFLLINVNMKKYTQSRLAYRETCEKIVQLIGKVKNFVEVEVE